MQDPLERAAEESGMYIEWMGKKMWAFGPAQRIVQKHLKTFEKWPPASPAAAKNAENLDEKLESTGGVGQ